MGVFTTRCQHCGTKISRRARFCSQCGEIPEGSTETTRCWRCKAEVSVKSKHCHQCSADLSEGQRPEVSDNQWVRKDDEFAVRIEVDDLPGLLKKELYIEAGTRAAFILDGQMSGDVGPGWYTLGGLLAKVPGLKSARRATAILTDAWDSEVDFTASVYTKDPIQIKVRLSLIVVPQDLMAIKGALLREKHSVTMMDIQQKLAFVVRQLVGSVVRKYSAQELETGEQIREEVEAALARGLAEQLQSAGVGFKSIRTLDFFYQDEKLDPITKTRERYYLQVAGEGAELEGKQRLFDVKNAAEIEEIRQEGAKLENVEKRIDVWGRMIDATQKKEMKELRSEADLRKFKQEIDKEGVLSDYDMEHLVKTVAGRQLEDEEKLIHALAILKAELAAERTRIQLVRTHEISDLEADHAFQSARRELLEMIELKGMSNEAAIKEMRVLTDAELEKRTKMGAAYREEAEQGAASRRSISLADFYADIEKQRQAAELKEEREEREFARFERMSKLDQETAQREAERKEAERRADHERRLEAERQSVEDKRRLMEALAQSGGASEATLAAVSGVTGDALTAVLDAIKMGQMKGMTAEQIAALAAEKNPGALRDLADVLNRQNPEVEKLYQRMLSEQKSQSDKSQEALERVMKMAMETTKDVVRGGAGGQNPTVVVAGGGTQVVGPQAGGTGAQAKTCPHCGTTVDGRLTICPNPGCAKPMS